MVKNLTLLIEKDILGNVMWLLRRADLKRIEEDIKTMPDYFADYNTIVHFVSQEELDKNHAGISHGGFVIHSGTTGPNNENKQLTEYSIKLGSNSDFTANVLLAYGRAAYRLSQEGIWFENCVRCAPAYLSINSVDDLRTRVVMVQALRRRYYNEINRLRKYGEFKSYKKKAKQVAIRIPLKSIWKSQVKP